MSWLSRRRSLLFKGVILFPALWFAVVLILAYHDRLKVGNSERHDVFDIRRPLGDSAPGIDAPADRGERGGGEGAGGQANAQRSRDNFQPAKFHDTPKGVWQTSHTVGRPDNGNANNNNKPVELDVHPRPFDGALYYRHESSQPGEKGRAVNIDTKDLTKQQQQLVDKGMKDNAFNQYASDMISIHRSLPDPRENECKVAAKEYKKDLPDTSVIITFHNEAWSVLLRTVHSVLERSPTNLINEVLLCDDASTMSHLKEPLDDYMSKLGKVRVLRAKERVGLIRGRLMGAEAAKGQVLTFLDSHCECAEGWLEPLLDPIARNWSNVVCPVIDVIDDNTLQFNYGRAYSLSVGGFDWNLQFNWHQIPPRERQQRKRDIDPVRSPTMAGGLFSVDKKYFMHIGAYDPGFDIWGAENLELSFKTWMCGGSLLIIPCSHVGHIFRKRSPYKWRSGTNVLKRNTVRLAEVWLDDYKKYYYERINYDLGDYGDVSDRIALRERLQCKSFDWYLKNIFPEQFVPGDAVAKGEIRNSGLGNSVCLDSPADKNHYNKAVYMYPCHRQGGNQYWLFSKEGEFRRDEACLDYSGGKDVIIYPCHGQKGNQLWKYDTTEKTIYHAATRRCMEMAADKQRVIMNFCNGAETQKWNLEHYDGSKLLKAKQ